MILGKNELDYAAICNYIFTLKEKYNFLKVFSIGKSVVGREIYALEIGGQFNEKVVFAAAFHGTERITTQAMLMFIRNICDALSSNGDFAGTNARNALYGKSAVIIPCVNPDGCEIALKGAFAAGSFREKVDGITGGSTSEWNANARGVDINHNFNAGFDMLKKIEEENGKTAPCGGKWGGLTPESEPETLALTGYCRKNNILHALAFHSQGEEIYCEYGEATPAKAYNMANLFAASSGYSLSKPEESASHGGFKDWFINEFERPAFTFELGSGINPLDPKTLNKIYEKIEECLLLAIVL